MDWDLPLGGFSISGAPIPLRMTAEERAAFEEAQIEREREARFWDEALERVFEGDGTGAEGDIETKP